MSIRNRTTKLLARRHDLNYFKRMSPLRAWQWRLALVALVCAVAWFSASTLMQGSASFSSGPISSSHAVFAQKCELCHVPLVTATRFTPAFGRRTKVPDSACLSCHVAGAHHPAESAANPGCSSCHTEHVGAMHLAATPDRGCTSCHADLQPRGGHVLNIAASVKSFAQDHPDFRPLRMASASEREAAFALRFNHAEHMHPGLSGPHGSVNLNCQSCHQPAMDANGRPGFAIAPVSFEKSCRSCHALDFDSHIAQDAPHASPEAVKTFVVQSITNYAQAHPQVVSAEIRNWPPQPPLPGQVKMPPPHTTGEWIENRVGRAEIILWREKCELCHRDLNRTPVDSSANFRIVPVSASTTAAASAITLAALPKIEPSQQPIRWFRAAVFSHPAHQSVACAECHTAALASVSGTDVLMPSIATCRKCHDGQSSPQGPPVKAGHAESGCFLCHVYHGAAPDDLTASHSIADLH